MCHISVLVGSNRTQKKRIETKSICSKGMSFKIVMETCRKFLMFQNKNFFETLLSMPSQKQYKMYGMFGSVHLRQDIFNTTYVAIKNEISVYLYPYTGKTKKLYYIGGNKRDIPENYTIFN